MSETDLATTDTAKAEVLKYSFALIFTGRCSHHTTQFTKSKDSNCENKELLTAGDQVPGYLGNLNTNKSMGPDEMCIGFA